MSSPPPTTENFRRYARRLVRLVEAQHRRSTERLTADLAEQDVLEALIEEAKPPLPAAAQGLHHLLATPFRYGYAGATRFRRAHERPGIFYGAEKLATAIAESAYWQMRFYAAAPQSRLPRSVMEYWAFTIPVKVARALDLSAEPFVAQRERWIDPNDYGACQAFATEARSIGAQLIRYESARDPGTHNAALFDAAAFTAPVPDSAGSWLFSFSDHGTLTARAPYPDETRYRFSFDDFGLTPPRGR
nr:RES family NAD+ phosphorylase [uncultured Sphingomonas sp.]